MSEPMLVCALLTLPAGQTQDFIRLLQGRGCTVREVTNWEAIPNIKGQAIVTTPDFFNKLSSERLRTLQRFEMVISVYILGANHKLAVALMRAGATSVVVYGTQPVLKPSTPQLTEEGGTEPILSARETQVLVLAAQGQSNKAIAQALFISDLTVKAHMRRILRKLGACDRAAAVAIALRNNILT
jgi:DNA-binding CsgD family transcriptional regulator